MATLPDIIVTSEDWISLSSASGLAVGTAVEIFNKSTNWVRVFESNVKPAADSNNGVIITNLNKPYAAVEVTAGSEEVWLKVAEEGRTASVSIQEV